PLAYPKQKHSWPICCQPAGASSRLMVAQASVNSRPARPLARGRILQANGRAGRLFTLASALGFGFALSSSLQAATASFSTTAPALGVNDLSQLTNAADRTNNVGGSVDDQGGNFVYLDNGRPGQGQTFITGGNANGYALTAVTLKQVAYDTYAFVPDMTYHI